MFYEKKNKYILVISLLVVCFLSFSRCTFLKMGTLFLSGDIKNKNFTRELDIEYTGRLVFIKVRINDLAEEFRFIFDTGAAFNVISPGIAKKLGIKGVVEDTIADSSRKRGKVKFCKIPRLTIANIPFYNTASAIMDLNVNIRLSCYHADGVIGANLLRLVNCWQIDYQNKKLRFSDQRRLPHPANTLFLPMKRSMQRIPEVAITVPGDLVLKMGIDLGSTAGLLTNVKTWRLIKEKNPGLPFITGHGEMGGGALGEDTGKTYSAIFKQISIAGKPFGPLLFRFMPNTFSTIGNGFFEDYTITFNWSLDRIGLSRYGSRKRNLTPPTFGFNYSLNQASGFLYIGFIYNQSPAQQAGLAVGDRILAVNGTRLTKVSTSTFCEFYLDPQKLLGSDNHIELVILRQGQEKTIHLEKKSLLTSH